MGSAVATTGHTSAPLLDTVVELADALASGHEIGEFLQLLVDRCDELLLAGTAGVLLESPGGAPGLAAAPRRRCSRSRSWRSPSSRARPWRPTGPESRSWSRTSRRAASGGRSSPPGSLRSACGRRARSHSGSATTASARSTCTARSHAGTPTTRSVWGRRSRTSRPSGSCRNAQWSRPNARAEQLQRALNSRVLIEQAKGVIAERDDMAPRAAFDLLRRHARSTNRRLRDVSHDLIEGRLEL